MFFFFFFFKQKTAYEMDSDFFYAGLGLTKKIPRTKRSNDKHRTRNSTLHRRRILSYPIGRPCSSTYLKSRQGSKDAERPFYIRDSQRPLAGICELELAAILRTQPSANRLLKRDLRQGAFRPILYRRSCRH